MKKLLRRFFTLGLAIATLGVTAQTLTQQWVYKTDIPAAGEAKWGCGKAGQIWVSNTTTQKLMYWDADGTHTMEVGTAGPAICIDDAGNVIVSTTLWSAAATALKVLPKGATELQDLAVTLPEGVNAAAMKFLGRAVGDVMSENGGAFCEFPSGNTKVAKIFVANGAQVVEKSFAADAGVTADSEGLAVLVGKDPESTTIAARLRGQYDFYLDGKALPRLNINSTQGGDVFMIGEKLYSLEPTGAAYLDAFDVVDRSGDAPVVIASHEAEFTEAAARPNPCCLSAEVVDEYTVNIYQYVPGQMAAKYVLALPKPMPKLEARNAYAYDIVVEQGENEYTVSYRLNAPASAVKIQLISDGEVYKEYAGTTLAEYANEEKTEVNNLNTVKIPAADLKVNATTKFYVSVESDVVSEPTAHSTIYSFWSPYGAVVDNNPNSKHFGRLLVTEAQGSLPAEGYHSSIGENGIGTGIYAFDQTFLPIKNSEGKYGFLAGMERETGTYAGTTTSIYDFKRLALSGDGRLFISRAGVKSSGVWELNPDNLEDGATPIFTGSLGEDGMITDANDNIVSGPATAMDVVGSKWDLKLAIVSCTGGYALSKPSHKVYVYNLGVEKSWDKAPSAELTSLDNMWINSATVNLCLDPDGNGLMVGQYRGTPSESEPAYKHASIWKNEIDYSDVSTPAGGAGMAWNADNTLFAMSTGKGKVGVFTVNKGENGPEFTKLYEFSTTCGTNTNALAFDYANNLYVVSNSGEKLRCFALPRDNGEVVTPAAATYDVTISSDEYPATLYIIGTPTNWTPDNGIKMEKGENGVYTAELTNTAAYCNIALTSVLSTDWDEVNANRWGFAVDNEEITIDQEHAIEKTNGAILIRGEAGSTYQVKVDMKNMTILVSLTNAPATYPEKLYMIGSLKDANWDIAGGKYELTTEIEGIYSIGGVEILDAYNGNGYFAFGSITTSDWNTFNALRYGPETKDTPVTAGTEIGIDTNGDTSYMIAAGTYDVKVDLTTKLLLITVTSGIEAPEADATDVIPGYGEIRIITSVDNTVTSIYNTAGQAIVHNSVEREFTVERGIYVVVVNGKSYKVAVR
ncbi:MAG: hypothetical protein ACI4BH_05270 [Muribaculaceae bacterium]